MAQVTLENLEKSFGNIKAVDGISLKIKDKEFLAPSIIIIGKIVEFKVNNNITKVSDVYLPDINKVQLYNKSQK